MEPPGRNPLYPHLGFILCPLNSQENKFLLLQAIRSMILCYGTPRKLVEWARQVIEGQTLSRKEIIFPPSSDDIRPESQRFWHMEEMELLGVCDKGCFSEDPFVGRTGQRKEDSREPQTNRDSKHLLRFSTWLSLRVQVGLTSKIPGAEFTTKKGASSWCLGPLSVMWGGEGLFGAAYN